MSDGDQLLLKYKCTCGKTWADIWDCEVDGECPECGTVMTPYYADEIKHDD